MNRYKGSEVPKVRPWLIPCNSFIILRNGTFAGGKGELVISPCNQLRFTLNDLLELQLRSASLVVLGDCKIGDFGNARIVDVIDGAETTYYPRCHRLLQLLPRSRSP